MPQVPSCFSNFIDSIILNISRCKTTSYRNPNMKLMVNVCGHNICENCVELLFVKVNTAEDS